MVALSYQVKDKQVHGGDFSLFLTFTNVTQFRDNTTEKYMAINITGKVYGYRQ